MVEAHSSWKHIEKSSFFQMWPWQSANIAEVCWRYGGVGEGDEGGEDGAGVALIEVYG